MSVHPDEHLRIELRRDEIVGDAIRTVERDVVRGDGDRFRVALGLQAAVGDGQTELPPETSLVLDVHVPEQLRWSIGASLSAS